MGRSAAPAPCRLRFGSGAANQEKRRGLGGQPRLGPVSRYLAAPPEAAPLPEPGPSLVASALVKVLPEHPCATQ